MNATADYIVYCDPNKTESFILGIFNRVAFNPTNAPRCTYACGTYTRVCN